MKFNFSSRKHVFGPLEWLILALALGLRVIFLDWRPAHFDEGVNGWFVDQFTTTGTFQYDPSNYHGPLHFYALFLSQTLFGRGLWQLRLPVVVVSVATVWLLLRLRHFLPASATRLAALGFAVSPAMVFYGRYSIHETWLVFFLVMGWSGFIHFQCKKSRESLWWIGMAVTGAVLTKETYILHFVAFALAFPFLLLWERVVPSVPSGPTPLRSWRMRDLVAVSATGCLLLVFFYSGNLQNWPGLLGPFQTIFLWAETGLDGHGHEKPWWYWLWLMARFEWPALFGFLACVRFMFCAERLPRYLAIFGSGTLLAYSLIAYKTPWCGAAIFWPFVLLFGMVVAEWFRTGWRVAAAFLAVALLGHSLWQTIQLNFFRYADERHPYVYVQTHEDIHLLLDPLFALTREDSSAWHLKGFIMLRSVYPLPWILKDFTRIEYYSPGDVPDPPDAAFLMAEKEFAGELRLLLRESYHEIPMRLRAGQEPMVLWMNRSIFKNQPERDR